MNRPFPGIPPLRSLRCLAGSAWVLALAAIVAVVAGGCASSQWVSLRSVPKNPLATQLDLDPSHKLKPSDRTMQLLRMYDLAADVEGPPQPLLEKLHAISQREPSPEIIHATAELSYLAGKHEEQRDPQAAMSYYGAAVLQAYQYLFDSRFDWLRNPYDPHFRRACDLYNSALESSLRLVCLHHGLKPNQTYTIRTAAGEFDITCVLRGSRWRPEDFEEFKFVSDYEVTGLTNRYHTYGLGAPLIAVRKSYAGEPPTAKFYPAGLSFPVTAFLRPVGGTNAARPGAAPRQRAVLELYDPLSSTDTLVGDQIRVPLESDLSTPLAYFLANPDLEQLATVGLLYPGMLLKTRPDRQDPIMGLYMMQPYEPGKIPVLMVHGLWSSPMTWMEMFNDLRNSPEIRERYQFWFYLYPTGEPFLISAAQLRRDLADARQILDPKRQDPALDQMVLVGHSMGGLLARLQTLESGEDYWRIVSDKPFQQVKADPQTIEKLHDCFYFHPNPSIARVITIGTPHRGSNASTNAIQWITGKLIQLPTILVESQEKFFRENRGLFRNDLLLTTQTSIDALAPSSPVFPVMLASRQAPWVRYHNIVGEMPKEDFFASWFEHSDGVVTYQSAHMDDVESEIVVPADHTTVHANPRSVLEVRRILAEHVAQLAQFPNTPPPRHQVARLGSF